MMGEKKKAKLIQFLLFLSVAIISFVAGTRYDSIIATLAPVIGVRSSSERLDLSSVQKTFQQLVANYDGQLDHQKLIYGASRGLTEAAGDPHTSYMDPDEAEEFNKSLHGNIGGGIGAEIGMRKGKPTIVRPLENSPAKEAGIMAGEVILKVNDESVIGWDVEKVVSKVRGDIDTSVKLTLLNGDKSHEVSVIRRNIVAPAVESKIEGEIGILKVSRFSDDTVTQARQLATEFKQKGVKKVILDLRGNPGGTVNSAQGLLGLWLDKQVVMTERRGSEVIKELKSTGHPILADVKTVVLINENSASASEITAGALREYGKAKIVGQKSYGKGSVQRLVKFSSGAQMKITEARWYTPQGKNIDKSGIEPDEKVEMTMDDVNNNRDPQLEKAKSL